MWSNDTTFVVLQICYIICKAGYSKSSFKYCHQQSTKFTSQVQPSVTCLLVLLATIFPLTTLQKSKLQKLSVAATYLTPVNVYADHQFTYANHKAQSPTSGSNSLKPSSSSSSQYKLCQKNFYHDLDCYKVRYI